MSELALQRGAFQVAGTNPINSRIVVQKRAPGTLQLVKDATVYILRLPALSPTNPAPKLPEDILMELRAHLGVLRANHSAITMVLAPRLLPEPGSVDLEVEAITRLHDLYRLQLANEGEIEIADLVGMVNSVHDTTGLLVVVNKLGSRTTATMALGVKYQAYANQHHEAEPNIM